MYFFYLYIFFVLNQIYCDSVIQFLCIHSVGNQITI